MWEEKKKKNVNFKRQKPAYDLNPMYVYLNSATIYQRQITLLWCVCGLSSCLTVKTTDFVFNGFSWGFGLLFTKTTSQHVGQCSMIFIF